MIVHNIKTDIEPDIAIILIAVAVNLFCKKNKNKLTNNGRNKLKNISTRETSNFFTLSVISSHFNNS